MMRKVIIPTTLQLRSVQWRREHPRKYKQYNLYLRAKCKPAVATQTTPTPIPMPKPDLFEPTQYMTVQECKKVCRFKGPEPIRRAVYRGELPGVRLRANRLLIPASACWAWFHSKDVKPKPNTEVEQPVLKTIKLPRRAKTEEAA